MRHAAQLAIATDEGAGGELSANVTVSGSERPQIGAEDHIRGG
jgi:hypothetical protein